MECYDPDKPIDPVEWMALDEGQRDCLVEQYHRKKRIRCRIRECMRCFMSSLKTKSRL